MLCSRRYGSIEAGHEPHPIENSYSTLVTGGLSQIQYTLTVGTDSFQLGVWVRSFLAGALLTSYHRAVCEPWRTNQNSLSRGALVMNKWTCRGKTKTYERRRRPSSLSAIPLTRWSARPRCG